MVEANKSGHYWRLKPSFQDVLAVDVCLLTSSKKSSVFSHLVDPVPEYDLTSWRLFPFRIRLDVTLEFGDRALSALVRVQTVR